MYIHTNIENCSRTVRNRREPFASRSRTALFGSSRMWCLRMWCKIGFTLSYTYILPNTGSQNYYYYQTPHPQTPHP